MVKFSRNNKINVDLLRKGDRIPVSRLVKILNHPVGSDGFVWGR